MTRQQAQDYAEFVQVLQVEFNLAFGTARDIADELCSLAKKARHYDIARCNYELTERQQKRSEAIDERAKEIAAELGCGLQFGDPRGCAYRLLLPSKRSNSFGGEGWIVPEV